MERLAVCARHLAVPAAAAASATIAGRAWARNVSARHAGPADLEEAIAKAEPTGLRVAVIGIGISGTQAMKTCLAEGIEPVGFEADDAIGGFWRYKQDPTAPSVYRSTHIDTDRELNCFGDNPWSPEKPLVLHNSDLHQYLQENLEKFDCVRRIRFRTRVTWVTSVGQDDAGNTRWEVSSVSLGTDDKVLDTKTEVFDGVIICTGRHGGSGYIPRMPGMDSTKVRWMHSSRYKHPDAHDLEGKRVVVVGIGNSGCDIVTENSATASQCWLVARSGGWVMDVPRMGGGPHGDYLYTKAVITRGVALAGNRLPWYVRDKLIAAPYGPVGRGQAVLNKHGLKPEHKFGQQHIIATGIAGQNRLPEELKKGTIIGKRGIDRFTEHGVVFKGDSEETAVDAVIFATGYRQAVSFLDPSVVDMRYDRDGNDVPLYKGCLPVSSVHNRIAFVNFIQSVTFMCADLHARYITRVFKGLIPLPTPKQQLAEVEAVRATLCAQYIDRQQLRVQHGLNFKFYEDLAEAIGCRPSLARLWRERPTALWHALLTSPQASQFRLVGPGRMERAERWVEDLHRSRYYDGILPNGQKKPGPRNRLFQLGRLGIVDAGLALGELVSVVSAIGLYRFLGGDVTGPLIQDERFVNERYAATDTVEHSKAMGAPVAINAGQEVEAGTREYGRDLRSVAAAL